MHRISRRGLLTEMRTVTGSQIECFGTKMFLFKGVVLDKTLTLFENVSRLFLFALSMYLHCGQAGNTHRHNQIYCRSKVQENLNAVVKFT